MSTLGIVYIVGGALCVAYYLLIGFFARFGMSASWVWLAIGATLIACGLLTRANLPPWLRVAWRALLCLWLALLVGLECLVVSGMTAAAPPGMDYLVVLGASVYQDGPSPALTRRINAVMAALPDHPDAVIIASGGQGANEPISEAACIRDELVKRGVDPARIVLEGRSSNTLQNMAYSAALIADPAARVAVVTNNYHIWRALRMARRAGLTNVYGIAAEYTGPTLPHFMFREAISIALYFTAGKL